MENYQAQPYILRNTASNHLYQLPLRRCLNNSRLVASSNLETLHRSFTTFTIRIVLKISTND